MTLEDPRVDKLLDLIRDTFRVRANHTPRYVDINDHARRFKAKQHQVLFGRRGSGKTCLVVHCQQRLVKDGRDVVLVDADEIKTLGYPDILIRLLVYVMQGLREQQSFLQRLNPQVRRLKRFEVELRELLDRPEQATATRAESDEREADFGGAARGARASRRRKRADALTTVYATSKREHLERHLPDYKAAVQAVVSDEPAYLILDDFYLLPRERQPDVVDFLHRLCRGTNLYLKIATVRHRTTLARQQGQTVGMILHQDVEPIDLDKTFVNVVETSEYLLAMLDELARFVGIFDLKSGGYLNAEAPLHLALASGGVPRDYLNIFVEAVEAARRARETRWLTKSWVYKGASRLSMRTKLDELQAESGDDADVLTAVFRDLVRFCLQEKKQTTFLIGHDDARDHPAENELIQQLADFKLIHVVEPDTSAASGRPGRYAAYTLDFALFMDPRKRNIVVTEFWKIDAGRRRLGLRESPTYRLDRAASVATDADSRAGVIDQIVSIAGSADATQ